MRSSAVAAGAVPLVTNLIGVEALFAASPAPTTAPVALNLKIAELAVAEGAAFLGAAEMADAYARLARMLGKPLPAAQLPRAISIGVALSDELVEPLPGQMGAYSRHFYGAMWPKAKTIARKLGELLRKDGYKVAYGMEGVDGLPKMVARLAGMGWIGRGALLVTPEVGPRAAWEVVLTDAPVKATAAKVDEPHCGDCRRCVDTCPVKAITGAEFKETDPLTARFLPDKCEKYRQSFGNIFTEGGCGLCVKVCPYGAHKDVIWRPPAGAATATKPVVAAIELTTRPAAPTSQLVAMPLAKTDRSAWELEAELRGAAEKAGADLVGIADVSPVYATLAEMTRKPVNQADTWPRAISIGVAMNDRIVDGIPKITPEYGKHMYRQAWPAANRVAAAVGAWLKNQGFAVAAGGNAWNSVGSKILPGAGYKIAARYSGLAWIGKSCLAVSPQFGPRVMWAVVFTDAPLTPSVQKPRERQCGDCQRCVDVCPAKAYTGIPFNEKDPPQKRFDTGKCARYRAKLGNNFEIGACGLCLEICPYGKQSNILLGQKPVVPITPTTYPAPVSRPSK